MKYSEVKEKKELDILKNQKANYKNLKFQFTENFLKKLKSKLNAKNSIQIIVKKEEDFVGYIAGFEKLRFLWVSELFVSEKYQKKKVGSKLLNRVIKKSKENKLKGIIAQTEFENIPAQKLYLKNGFTKIKNPLWKDGITFKKNL